MAETLILHEDPRSGNCYKIRLTAALLDRPIERKAYDIMRGETRAPDFLDRINPAGRIPVLEVGSGAQARFLPESNAACWYIAEGSSLIPRDRFDRAQMLRWMFFEQYSHEPNIATLRFWLHFIGEDKLGEERRNQVMAKRIAGEEALSVMNAHLATRAWFVGEAISLADISLFAYTHVCEAGGFRLRDYPHVGAWLARIAALPRFVAMD